MRLVAHLPLVLVLAFALSGAQALAAPACCVDDCAQQASGPEDSHGPEDSSHREERCPPLCHACPCARLVAPGPGTCLALPAPTAGALVGWLEPDGLRGRLSPHDIFQPPRR